jgi:hypothetical protein
VKHDNRLQTVDGGLHARSEIAISDGEYRWHGLDVIHVENDDSLEFLEWRNVELQARSHLSAIQVASKDQVGRVWDNWLRERLKRHSKTDSRIELRVVRLAADGVWLERIVNAKSKNPKGVEEYHIKMTRIR